MNTWNNDTVRQLERGSIRSFMQRYSHLLVGRVLDFGSGKQPYRDLVIGDYVPYDPAFDTPPISGTFDTIMCNQVMQYVTDPLGTLIRFHALLNGGGRLVMTYPTNWDEVETCDLWRFTRYGMDELLKRAGFTVQEHERRAAINLNGFQFPLGYGVVASR